MIPIPISNSFFLHVLDYQLGGGGGSAWHMSSFDDPEVVGAVFDRASFPGFPIKSMQTLGRLSFLFNSFYILHTRKIWKSNKSRNKSLLPGFELGPAAYEADDLPMCHLAQLSGDTFINEKGKKL